MNIYRFELKQQLKNALLWTLGIIIFMLIFMSGVYPVFYDSKDDVLQMLSNFPSEFAAAFGLNIDDLFSFSGFFSFTFVYLAIAGAIMAVSLSLASFAREKRSKCLDFLLTKPRSRESIFIAKLLSSLTLIIIANIMIIITAVILYKNAEQDSLGVGKFILAAGAIFFTQLVFLAVGIFFAVFAKKVRFVAGIATAFGFGGFILSMLNEILEKDTLRFIAPLKYFDPGSVLLSGGYELKYVITAIVVIIACIALSYFKYVKSDAHAV